MKKFLETERMLFVEFEKFDHSLIMDLDSDPEVVKYISNGVPSDEAEINRAMNIFLTFNKRYKYKLGFWESYFKRNK